MGVPTSYRHVASPSDCEPRPVRLFNLLRSFGALKLSVLDVFEPVGGHLVSSNEVARIVGAFDPPSYSLEQSAVLIG